MNCGFTYPFTVTEAGGLTIAVLAGVAVVGAALAGAGGLTIAVMAGDALVLVGGVAGFTAAWLAGVERVRLAAGAA
jgi:hypothetical protein